MSWLTKAAARRLVERVKAVGKRDKLQLAISTASAEDPGDLASEAKAITALCKLSPIQLERIEQWIERSETQKLEAES